MPRMRPGTAATTVVGTNVGLHTYGERAGVYRYLEYSGPAKTRNSGIPNSQDI